MPSFDEILNSVEEQVKEGETWVLPEESPDNFSKAKEQQDLMKVGKSYVFNQIGLRSKGRAH